MLTPEAQRKLTTIGIFVLPIVLVIVFTNMYGGGTPSGAEASISSAANNPSVSPLQIQTWTDRQIAAAQYADSLQEKSFGSSPLLHDVTVKITPSIVDTSTDPALPKMRLKAVLSSPTGNKALINSNIYRVGDQVRDTGFRVDEINSSEHSVTLTNPELNSTIVIRVEIPLPVNSIEDSDFN